MNDDPLQDRTDARLTELEIKASYSEDLLDRLNEVVVRQQAQIEALQRELVRWREQALAAPQQPAFRSLRDELPPHY
jgi:SlyX protein